MNRPPTRATPATTVATTLVAALLLAACATEPASTPAAAGRTTTSEPTATAVATTATSAEPSAEPADESASPSPTESPTDAPTDALLAVELTDVRTGESFTLGEVAADDGPVLLQPMAIWCTSCRAQQHEVKRAHELGTFTSVSLDIELSELPEDLARYATDQGWDWRFAVADAPLYRLLGERFGTPATHPPSTPLIVIEADGTVRPLEFGAGVRTAEQLLSEIGAG